MGMNSPCVNCGADAKVCKECDWYNGVWISKNQYETRLKADMVAMLEDFDLEIHEWRSKESACYIPNYEAFKRFSNFIQEKINSLKENTDGME